MALTFDVALHVIRQAAAGVALAAIAGSGAACSSVHGEFSQRTLSPPASHVDQATVRIGWSAESTIACRPLGSIEVTGPVDHLAKDWRKRLQQTAASGGANALVVVAASGASVGEQEFETALHEPGEEITIHARVFNCPPPPAPPPAAPAARNPKKRRATL